jgi:hypothetical protein
MRKPGRSATCGPHTGCNSNGAGRREASYCFWPRPAEASAALERLRAWTDLNRLAQNGGAADIDADRRTVEESCSVLDPSWTIVERAGDYLTPRDPTPEETAALQANREALGVVLADIRAAEAHADLPALVRAVEAGRDVDDRASVREWLDGAHLLTSVGRVGVPNGAC